jgi:hypothetical protein
VLRSCAASKSRTSNGRSAIWEVASGGSGTGIGESIAGR